MTDLSELLSMPKAERLERAIAMLAADRSRALARGNIAAAVSASIKLAELILNLPDESGRLPAETAHGR